MTRLQWFEISKFSSSDLRRLTKRLLDEKYDDSRGWGYMVSQARLNVLTGKFIEKETKIERVIDPFGKTQSFQITIYREIVFRFQPEWPQLQIENPPRNLGPFFTSIGEYLDFTIGISEIEISPAEWVRVFQRKFSAAKVVKAQINNIIVSNSTAAVLVVAGSEDVRQYFQTLTGGRRFNLSFVQIEFADKEDVVRFEVNEFTKVKLISGNEEHSAAFFRECIASMKH